MLYGQSSFLSNKYNGAANSLGHKNDHMLNILESRLEKMQLAKNDGCLNLNLPYGDYPVAPHPDQESSNSCESNMSSDDLNLGLGTLLSPIFTPHDIQHDSVTKSLIPTIGRENSIKALIRCPRYNYANVAQINRNFREFIKSGDIYKIRSINGITEHWVYFSCHALNWEAFDPLSKKWMHLPMLNCDICFELSDKESMAAGTDLLVLGRDVYGQAIYKYSLLTNSWSSGMKMNKPRCLFGSASLGKTAIFAGGVNCIGKIMDTVESYDSETGAWEMLPSLLKPRKMSSGVVMDGKFYVIGGSGGHDGKSLSCGEEYDPETRKWREIPSMLPGGGGGSMAPPLLAVVANELYVADSAAMEVKKYDKEKNAWESIGRLPKRASNVDGWGMAFRGCGDRVIIIGGPRRQGDSRVDIYSWVPSEGPPQWTLIGRKISSNFVYNCTIMGC